MMNGGVMKSQRARVGAGYMPPALPFAQLPNPDSVIGQVYIASNVGPAPGIELVADGTRWRPRGGRQVIAMRANNPVTVQSTVGGVAATIGPFPGGLVRAGMALEMDVRVGHSGIGTGERVAKGNINGAFWWHASMAQSGASLELRRNVILDAVSDTNATHRRLASTTNSFAPGSITATINVDFSAPWSTDIALVSAVENAVNISSATWAGGIATFNTSAPHTLAVGDKTVTAGVTPTGWNIPAGAFVLSVPTTTQFTVDMAADPGAYSTGGTSSRISNMILQSYVLELVG